MQKFFEVTKSKPRQRVRGNLALTVPIKPSTIDRDKFFEELEKIPFEELYNRYKSNFKNSIRQTKILSNS